MPSNVSRATARYVLAFGTCMGDETVNVVQINRYQRRGQVLVALCNSCRCSLLPHAHLSCDTLRIVPAIWQRLPVVNSFHRPKANSSGMTVTPAIAMAQWVRFCRVLRKQMCNRACSSLNFSIGTRGSASSHHVAHAAALDIRLICTQENVSHLSWTPLA